MRVCHQTIGAFLEMKGKVSYSGNNRRLHTDDTGQQMCRIPSSSPIAKCCISHVGEVIEQMTSL